MADDSRMRWLRPGEVPTLGHWFRAAGYDTHYDGKWHISHADLTDPATGGPLATNDDDGVVDPAAVQAYLDADPLDPYGFSGWVGPEPHGAPARQQRPGPRPAHRRPGRGLARGPLRPPPAPATPTALRPFLLVASFVNPHDIVLFPAWERGRLAHRAVAARPAAGAAVAHRRRGPAGQARRPDRLPGRLPVGLRPGAGDRPHLPAAAPSATATSTTGSTPRSTARSTGCAGPSPTAAPTDAVLVRTSDHGELLGAHGGLHQKWFNLYDEATRVPFVVARVGQPADRRAARGRRRADLARRPRAHPARRRGHRRRRRSPPAGRGLHRGAPAARARPAARGRRRSRGRPAPGRSTCRPATTCSRATPVRPAWPAGSAASTGRRCRCASRCRPTSATSFEGIVARVEESSAPGSRAPLEAGPDLRRPGHLDRARRPPPAPPTGPGGPAYRTAPLADQWELYDLDADPIEARQPLDRPDLEALRSHLRDVLKAEPPAAVPERNEPWPYAARRPSAHPAETPPQPALALRRAGPAPRHAPRRPACRSGARPAGPAGARRRAPTTACSTSASRPACSPAR